MKLAHNVEVSVFIKPEDDGQKTVDKLCSLFPFDIKDEKLKKSELFYDISSVKSFGDRTIQIHKVVIRKSSLLNQFLKHLMHSLSQEQKELIARQLDSRVDDNGNFFMRLDIEKILQDQFWICDEGSCFHIRINLASFPKTKERALEVARQVLAL
ncbi:hypothetical protein JW968_06245 [Candidatus Woesearchaeota archaeon]|nr:hypothetical protein [Candidatus Woesearchaeota archaeon]